MGAINQNNESRNKSRLKAVGSSTMDGKKHSHDIRMHSPLGAETLSNIDARLAKMEETPTQ